MKILRFSTPDLEPGFGWLHEDQVGQIDGDPFSAYRRLEPYLPVDTVKLLPPVVARQDHLRGPQLRRPCQGIQ